jgi:Na+:H+ antiporter, NhaA family
MSLFIGSLAFGGFQNPLAGFDRIGILMGSIVSAVIGYLILKRALPERSYCLLGTRSAS